ncbi:MAG: enoyl-CoA hydratase/isomerase family protein [Pseudomonadota bacterium]
MSAILVQRTDHVATVILNRPERLNALNRPMWSGLAETFASISSDLAVRCVVLTGAGRSFSPGADISEFADERGDPDQAFAYGEVMAQVYREIQACPHPVVASIRGPCTGAGLVLALASDLRVSAESGRFGAPVSRLGLAMPLPEFAILFDAIGKTRTLEVLFEATVMDANRACEIGLVNRVVADGELDKTVTELAAKICAGAPLVNRWHKKFAQRLIAGGELSADEIKSSYESFGTNDYREGFQAFLDKRSPRFRGE